MSLLYQTWLKCRHEVWQSLLTDQIAVVVLTRWLVMSCEPPPTETSDPLGGKNYNYIHHIKLFIYYNQTAIVVLTALSLVPYANLNFVLISISLSNFWKAKLIPLHS